jgi:signal transduction histidine kinase
MIFAITPPALAGSSLGMLLFVEPSVPPEQLLVRVMGMTAVILFFLGVAAPLFTRSVTLPLRELTAGTERLTKADFSAPVPELASDEFGVLARTLNEAMSGGAERRRLAIEVRESRARIVTASDESRRQIERDLHDGAQQYLVLMELKLGLLARRIADDPEASAMTAELRSDLSHALAELRDLSHGLYPAVLETDGLAAALRAAGERSPLPVTVESDGLGREASEVEAAVYFCCLEAMQNAGKHAGEGASIAVTLGNSDGRLRFTVADDGRGYNTEALGTSHGLQNMADRIGALGGELTIESTPGQGTTVAGSVPV